MVQIAAGSNHVLALTYKGVIYGWGSNKACQLGFANKNKIDIFLPKVIGENLGKKVQQIFAGKNNSVAICKDDTILFWGVVIQLNKLL